jgi:mRNA interferase RelE/StbE
MSYNVILPKSVQKQIITIPKEYHPKIFKELENLKINPRPYDCLKITGQDAWRIRVGVYRIIYEIDDENKVVTIYKILHRKEAYN